MGTTLDRIDADLACRFGHLATADERFHAYRQDRIQAEARAANGADAASLRAKARALRADADSIDIGPAGAWRSGLAAMGDLRRRAIVLERQASSLDSYNPWVSA